MHKLYEDVMRELRSLDENGININNIDVIYKLTDIAKDLCKIKKCEEERYSRGGNYERSNYNSNSNYERGGYNGRMNRIIEDNELYEYGRQRYRNSGDRSKLHEGLDKLMYSICAFVKEIEDFAETQEEKEIVRKHIQNLRV